ncbi:MAG: hypothetical protein OXF23_02700, partial [Candidatus Dadabacteria bacterium]|nr:hypothetical protein [Candidatus Dadabacteria bacterium]
NKVHITFQTHRKALLGLHSMFNGTKKGENYLESKPDLMFYNFTYRTLKSCSNIRKNITEAFDMSRTLKEFRELATTNTMRRIKPCKIIFGQEIQDMNIVPDFT